MNIVRFAAFALLAAAPLLGQVKETVNVTVVEVPVTVVGRDGNPIRGLTAANFEVLDEGKKRPIASFDAIDFASLGSTRALSPLNPAAHRNFMLVFDLSFSQPGLITRAQNSAREFVAKSVQPSDRIGVATLDVARGFRLLTAFTTDRSLIEEAIANPRSFHGNDPLQLAGRTPMSSKPSGSEGVDKSVPEDRSGQKTLAATRQNIVEETERINIENTRTTAALLEDANDKFNRQKAEREIDLLMSLSQAMRGVTGRKQIVLLSEGFDPRLIQGRGASESAETARPRDYADSRDAVAHGEVWKVDNDNRFGNSASLKLVDRFAEACRRADVVLHAIDIRGIRVQSDVQIGAFESSNEGLHILADATGGTVFKNTNDLTSALDKMVHQQEVVYILGINAPSSEPGKFHPLKVKLINVAGGRLSARTGYYEAGLETDASRTLTTAEIIINDIPQNDLRVDSVAMPFPGSNGSEQVPVIVDINGADLLDKSGDDIIFADVFVYAFDDKGIVRDSLFQRLTLDANRVGEKLRAGGAKYYGTLSLPPGTYAVKTLVRIADLRVNGFTRTDVVVPAPSAVAMTQPLFFEDSSRWVLVRGASHDPDGAYPFTVGDETFVPSATARLRSGEHRRFAFFVTNASPDAASIEVSPRARLVAREPSANGAAFVFDLDPADLKSSTSLEVTMGKGRQQLKSALPISVQ